MLLAPVVAVLPVPGLRGVLHQILDQLVGDAQRCPRLVALALDFLHVMTDAVDRGDVPGHARRVAKQGSTRRPNLLNAAREISPSVYVGNRSIVFRPPIVVEM